MNDRNKRKNVSNIFFVCSITEHTRDYHIPQGVMEGGVNT